MQNKPYLCFGLISVLLAGSAKVDAADGESAEGRRVNIILLESDDHHWEALGCMGGPVQTPHIDKLAARGVLFRNNICQGTACSPSRNSLLTASYPHNTGVYYNQDGNMPEGIWTFPQAMQRAGYLTALVGKNHFKPPSSLHWRQRTAEMGVMDLQSLGFEYVHAIAGKVSAAISPYVPGQDLYRDYLQERGLLEKLRADYQQHRRGAKSNEYQGGSVVPEEHYHDVYIADRTIDFIHEHDRQRPFFVWVDFVAPHPPTDAPEPYASMYDWREMPERIPPPEGAVLRGRKAISEENLKKFKAGYYGMVTLLDKQVGRIVAALEESGQLENTVIVFTGDQGSMLGDHGEMGKSVFYKGSVNAPLVIAGPPFVNHGVVDRPVELNDLGPTFLEFAGASAEDRKQCKGESLMPLLTGKGEYRRKYAFAEEYDTKMVVDERWKYVQGPEPMLFDLKEDPQELVNLAGMRPQVEARLATVIAQWLEDTGPVREKNPKAAPRPRTSSR